MHIRKDFCKNIFKKINLQSALLYSTKYSVSKIACCRGATGGWVSLVTKARVGRPESEGRRAKDHFCRGATGCCVSLASKARVGRPESEGRRAKDHFCRGATGCCVSLASKARVGRPESEGRRADVVRRANVRGFAEI